MNPKCIGYEVHIQALPLSHPPSFAKFENFVQRPLRVFQMLADLYLSNNILFTKADTFTNE